MRRRAPSHALFLSSLAFSALCLNATRGQAQVAFDNFGAGNTFNSSSAWEITGINGDGSTLHGRLSIGEEFTPSISGALSSITVAIQHVGGTNDLHLYLSDASTGIPGTTLEAFTATNLPVFAGGASYTPVTLTSALHPLLTAGNSYYLYDYETSDEYNLWNVNSTGGTGTQIYSIYYNPGWGSLSNEVQGAFRITVTSAAVPEPGSIALLIGITGIGSSCLRRRRKQ